MVKFSASFLSLLAFVFSATTQASAYDPTCSDNLAVYWGQNSYGAVFQDDIANWQQTISAYCQDSTIDAIPIAFVNVFFSEGGLPELDLGSICTSAGGAFSGTNLANCQFLAAGIEECQANGKLVTISLGGESGSVSFSSDAQGSQFANTVWDLFLGGSSSTRPFGSAVLDGVDLDIEVGSPTGFAAFVNQIRFLSEGADKRYYVTAAPQCPFPDAHLGSALNEAEFDAIYVQFYNNFCEVSQPDSFNFGQWDDWAKNVSPNPDVKIFVGAPASPTAATDGYLPAEDLASMVISAREQYSSLGGVMLWDASQAWNNGRYDQQIKNLIDNGCAPSGGNGNGGGSPPPSAGCAKTYQVVSGDTCSAIESRFGVSDATLRQLNPNQINSGCTNLDIGQTLCVQAACVQSYTIVSGDTCSAIESRFILHQFNPTINSRCTMESQSTTLM